MTGFGDFEGNSLGNSLGTRGFRVGGAHLE